MTPRRYTYRFAQPGKSSLSATATNLQDLKAKIECWFPGNWMTYKLDENHEGWAYWMNEPFGYIDRIEV